MSQLLAKIRTVIEFREVNFYAGLAAVAIGGETICRGAGLLAVGVFLVYYAVWRLR